MRKLFKKHQIKNIRKKQASTCKKISTLKCAKNIQLGPLERMWYEEQTIMRLPKICQKYCKYFKRQAISVVQNWANSFKHMCHRTVVDA